MLDRSTVTHGQRGKVGGAMTNRVEYVHRDSLGSVDVVTGANGAAVSTCGDGASQPMRTSFDPFGGRRERNCMTLMTDRNPFMHRVRGTRIE